MRGEAELYRRYTAVVQLGGRLFIAFSGTSDETAAYAAAGGGSDLSDAKVSLTSFMP